MVLLVTLLSFTGLFIYTYIQISWLKNEIYRLQSQAGILEVSTILCTLLYDNHSDLRFIDVLLYPVASEDISFIMNDMINDTFYDSA